MWIHWRSIGLVHKWFTFDCVVHILRVRELFSVHSDLIPKFFGQCSWVICLGIGSFLILIFVAGGGLGLLMDSPTFF